VLLTKVSSKIEVPLHATKAYEKLEVKLYLI